MLRPFIVLNQPLLTAAAATMLVASLTSAEESTTFFRGLNLNGPAVTIDGNVWEASDSVNYICKDNAFEQQSVALVPSTDADRARMIRSSRWGGNRIELTNVPSGTYPIYLYVWEDNNPEIFSILVNGQEVESRFNSGGTGHWKRLGPWYTDSAKERIVLTSQGGAANFSGVEIYRGHHEGIVEPPLAPEKLAFFENRIRPLLIEHCYECHSSTSDDLQAGLLVDSRPTMRRGGASGPAIIPGDVEHSLLIKAIHADDDSQMPPDEKLTASEIADLEHWVASGAADPRSDATRYVRKKIDVEKARQFWSLRPIADPAVPTTVANSSWASNEIDYFILRKLEEQGLQPVVDADERTLIRRVTYDLTGLPPSPEEIHNFLTDDSPMAFERVVDRLLDSPQYGERWGRHWMDLVRYADTAGDNSDYPIPAAYLYRDYIIDSFNADKPYDEFIREQIAGDLLTPVDDADQNENTIATGYIAISRRFGSVTDRYPQHLTIEDSLDNIGRTMLGMTLTCARCHDHKFDPISQEDYYGLYGIFQSSRYPFPGIELDKIPKDFVPLVDDGKPSETLAYAMADAQASDAALQVRGDPKQTAEIIPRKFPDVLGGQMLAQADAHHSGRLQLASWITATDNPLTARVMINRIWQFHFGSGLVKTPSDFGIRGTPPTHPELLDWLASRFIADQWSIKSMHRRMLLSRTYRLNSFDSEPAESAATRRAAVDPSNDLHWRFNRRRLDAESLRDTMLALSGDLDPAMGREPHPFPPADKWEYTQHHPFRDSYETNRRSVYMMSARLNSRPFFTTFDGADRNASTAQRDSSVTTVQSLYLLNDDFVYQQTRRFAERILSESDNDDERIDLAFELTSGHVPLDDQRLATRRWLAQINAELRQEAGADEPKQLALETWSAFARVLFRVNEFLYVD